MFPLLIKSDIECPECGINGEFNGTEIWCPECGRVLQENLLDRGPEFVGDEGDRSIDVNPTSREVHALDLGSQVGSEQYGVVRNDRDMKLIWTSKRTDDEFCPRSLRSALIEYKTVTSELDIPEYVEEGGAILLRKLHDEGWTRGRERNKVLSGLLMTLCRKYGLIRTPEEIAEASNLSSEGFDRSLQVLDYYKKVSDELDMVYSQFTAVDYTKRLCDQFDIYGNAREKAIEIAEDMIGKGGYNPRTVAGGIIYIIGRKENLEITQEKISEESDTTCVSIRNRYQEIVEKFDMNLDKEVG